MSRIRKQGSAVFAYSRCVDSFVTSSVRVDVVMSDGELVHLLSPIGKQIVFAIVVAQTGEDDCCLSGVRLPVNLATEIHGYASNIQYACCLVVFPC